MPEEEEEEINILLDDMSSTSSHSSTQTIIGNKISTSEDELHKENVQIKNTGTNEEATKHVEGQKEIIPSEDVTNKKERGGILNLVTAFRKGMTEKSPILNSLYNTDKTDDDKLIEWTEKENKIKELDLSITKKKYLDALQEEDTKSPFSWNLKTRAKLMGHDYGLQYFQ